MAKTTESILNHSALGHIGERNVFGFLRSTVKRIRPSVRTDIQRSVRMMASRPTTRRLLNYVYEALTWRQKEYWHSEYSKLFRDVPIRVAGGTWQATFAGRRMSLPLSGENMRLEWDSALSLLGHEIEIKRAYAVLMRSPYRPTLFFDVGANYGLHSLLFLKHGIPTVSFEPNVHCHSYFRRVTEMNGVTCDLRAVALGREEGSVNLWFPKTETWFGTTVQSARDQIPSREQIETDVVRQTTLDRFVEETSLKPDLIKIDTEGAEAAVLYGAAKTLAEVRPVIIFESWPDSDRTELFKLFGKAEYAISTLRGSLNAPRRLKELKAFVDAQNNNFIAAPVESVKNVSSIFDAL